MVMTKRIRSRIQAAERSFLRKVVGPSLRDRARSRATASPHREEPAEVARVSVLDALWTPSLGGVPGMPRRGGDSEENPGHAERLCQKS